MIFFIAHGRTEGAALDGPEGVEIAGAGLGVKHWAWLVVCEFLKGFLVLWRGKQQAGGCISRKLRAQPLLRFSNPKAYSCCNIGACGVESGAQMFCVELRDGKHADTTLRATGPAGKAGARLLGCVAECGVDDWKEFVQY